jgi:hypothetical protein
MLRDAILRTIQAARIAGIRALLVHANSPEALQFDERRQLRTSPIDPMTLMLPLAEAEQTHAAPGVRRFAKSCLMASPPRRCSGACESGALFAPTAGDGLASQRRFAVRRRYSRAGGER